MYHSSFEHIYQINPLFYNDWSVLQTGFLIVYTGLSWSFVLAILLIVALFYFFYQCILRLLKQALLMKIGFLSKFLFVLLGVLFLLNLKYGSNISSANTLQYQSLLMVKNVQQSILAHKNLEKFSLDKMQNANNYQKANLQQQPNIVVLAIESYGEVLLNHPELRQSYLKNLNHFEHLLVEKGISASSALSISPVKGGLSWIAYSNFNLGFNLKNQGTYDALLRKPEIRKYNDFFRTFKKFGYKNYRLVPILKTGKIVIPWELYSSFYSVDQWITFEDLQYDGALYGFGPAPPDQFSLHKSTEMINKNEEPYTLFF